MLSVLVMLVYEIEIIEVTRWQRRARDLAAEDVEVFVRPFGDVRVALKGGGCSFRREKVESAFTIVFVADGHEGDAVNYGLHLEMRATRKAPEVFFEMG